jgi:hypothetical protein
MAVDFVQQDRRRLVAVPDTDREEWIESIQAYWELGKGAPSFTVAEVVAIRGELAVLYRARVAYIDGSATELLIVLEIDADAHMRRAVMFDVDDLAGALAELDRLNAADVRRPTAR